MAIDKIFDSETFVILKKALDTATLRQQALSSNIANVDTPGYKRADVSFEEELKSALNKQERLELKTTDKKHLSNKLELENVHPKIFRQQDSYMRNDFNNVDIELEMAAISKNNVAYNALAELISNKLKMVRSAINEGRK